MAVDGPRLDELRRRVEKDPASIAFAPLAEELRRTGELDEAVRVCQAGLEHHPAYLSARVTLGRALLEMRQYSEAHIEFEYVLHAAPDNLLARKCMTELQQLTGRAPGVEEPAAQAASAEAPVAAPPAADRALEDLEAWHARIQAGRAAHSGGAVLQSPSW